MGHRWKVSPARNSFVGASRGSLPSHSCRPVPAGHRGFSPGMRLKNVTWVAVLDTWG